LEPYGSYFCTYKSHGTNGWSGEKVISELAGGDLEVIQNAPQLTTELNLYNNHNKQRTIYLVGRKGVGKSTIVNRLCKILQVQDFRM